MRLTVKPIETAARNQRRDKNTAPSMLRYHVASDLHRALLCGILAPPGAH